MMKTAVHATLIVTLTVLTQVGGVIYVAALLLRKRLPRARGALGLAALFVALYVAAWAPVAWLASAAGRAPLPCAARDSLSVSAFSCVLHRRYADPALVRIAAELARAADERFPGTVTRALDANFPFFDGFPLPPHVSHDDGEKLDLAFYYMRAGVYQPGALGSPIGYWKFEHPTPNETHPCGGGGVGLRWDMRWFAPLTRQDLELDPARTRFALRWLATEGARRGVGKVFVEPHVRQRLDVAGDVIRFQGCRAARHDDHIHVQLR